MVYSQLMDQTKILTININREFISHQLKIHDINEIKKVIVKKKIVDINEIKKVIIKKLVHEN